MTKRRSSLATKSKSKKFTAFTAEPASWEKKIDDLPGIGLKTSAKLKDKGIEYVSTISNISEKKNCRLQSVV